MKKDRTTQQARGAITTGRMRYVLAFSLAGAVAALLLVAVTVF